MCFTAVQLFFLRVQSATCYFHLNYLLRSMMIHLKLPDCLHSMSAIIQGMCFNGLASFVNRFGHGLIDFPLLKQVSTAEKEEMVLMRRQYSDFLRPPRSPEKINAPPWPTLRQIRSKIDDDLLQKPPQATKNDYAPPRL